MMTTSFLINDPPAGSALATTVTFARTQPETLDRFVQAFVEAIALGKKDRTLAKTVYAKYLRLADDNLLELNHKVYLAGSIPKIPTFPPEALKNVFGEPGRRKTPGQKKFASTRCWTIRSFSARSTTALSTGCIDEIQLAMLAA